MLNRRGKIHLPNFCRLLKAQRRGGGTLLSGKRSYERLLRARGGGRRALTEPKEDPAGFLGRRPEQRSSARNETLRPAGKQFGAAPEEPRGRPERSSLASRVGIRASATPPGFAARGGAGPPQPGLCAWDSPSRQAGGTGRSRPDFGSSSSCCSLGEAAAAAAAAAPLGFRFRGSFFPCLLLLRVIARRLGPSLLSTRGRFGPPRSCFKHVKIQQPVLSAYTVSPVLKQFGERGDAQLCGSPFTLLKPLEGTARSPPPCKVSRMLAGTRLLCQRPLGWTVPSSTLRAWLSTCGLDSVVRSKEAKPKGGLGDFQARLAEGPPLQHFLQEAAPVPAVRHLPAAAEEDPVPYLDPGSFADAPSKVYLETYGCQMNVSDTEIAWSILQRSGYLRTGRLEEADVILLVTCSIREKAEQTVWNRLRHIAALKAKRPQLRAPLRIGILGCMAERLKEKILDQERLVDVVAGPDAYRDLPRLLAVAKSGQQAANVLLSLDETYADILPVQTNASGTSAFVSIMRGCDNMCSYCIVPFTRGRERSRPVASILQEVQMLSDQGVKEVTLLGQNVNSYRDTSEVQFLAAAPTCLSRGFSTIYKAKQGGLRFASLLDRVSAVDPEMRIRFTSPHPKDFPDEVFQVMRERRNLCKQLHLPVQSGSTRVLAAMKRGHTPTEWLVYVWGDPSGSLPGGYTREAYLDLVRHARDALPGVSLSSDFIAGFCGETEADHQQTVSLMREVRYNTAFIFAYSMRQKTRAFHRLQDGVPPEVKQQRLKELAAVFREEASRANAAAVGHLQVVLVEGPSKRSPSEWCGRNDGNIRVIFPNVELDDSSGSAVRAQPGDYVLVKISSASSQTLKGTPLRRTMLKESAAFC